MNNEGKGDMPSTGTEPKVKSVFVKKPQSFFRERPLRPIEMAPRVLRYQSRRDFLVFGAGALAALAGAGFISPATRYPQSFGCAPKYGLAWEGVVSEQSAAHRR